MLLPEYHLKAVLQSPEALVYEEPPNYGDAFTLIALGVLFLAFAVLGMYLGIENESRRRVIRTALTSGMGLIVLSVPYSIQSTISLERAAQMVIVHRSLLWVGWTIRYPLAEVERVFQDEGARRRQKRKTLALELKDGSYKTLTLWEKLRSLSAEEAQFNEWIRRFQRYEAHRANQAPRRTSEAEKWQRIRARAAADLRRDMRHGLYAVTAFVAIAALIVPFLHGNPLDRYWDRIGKYLPLVSMALWIMMIVEAVWTYVDWRYVRDLREIEEQMGAPER